MDQVLEQLRSWTAETRAVFATMARLVEYFGEDSQHALLSEALRIPRFWLEVLEDAPLEKGDSAQHPAVGHTEFECGRELAAMLTPLLVLLVEPTAEFVFTARNTLEANTAHSLLRPYGLFAFALGESVAGPLWRRFPDLAPEGYPL